MATIEFLSGPRAKEFVELSDPHTLLGRQSFCDIVIDVQGVSRQHARISHGDDGYTIEDLGSVNGTYVNKRRIRERQTLRDQDRILLFRVSAVFHLKTPAAPSSNGHPHVPEEETTSNILPGHDSDVIHAVPVNPELAPAGSTQAQLLAILAITRELATSLDVDQMLPRLLDCLFEVFPQVHNGHVLLRDEASGDLLPEAIRQGREGLNSDTFRPFNRESADQVMRSGEAVLSVVGADEGADSVLGADSLWSMCAPLIGPSGVPMGVVYLETGAAGQILTPDDLELLASAATVAGQMIEHAREHQAAVKFARRQRELAAAREMQLGLLPQSRPDVPGYRFHDFYLAAGEVGGDYYSYLPLENGRWGIAVGDVAGKGVPAALIMARFSAEVRYCLATLPTPAAAIDRLNRDFPDVQQRFITFALCILDPADHSLTVVVAGHMPPLWRKAKEGMVVPIGEDLAGPPLGAAGHFNYRQSVVHLQPGDSILMYTDGISEACGGRNRAEHYGTARIQDRFLTGSSSPDRIVSTLLEDVNTFTHGQSPGDDVCIVSFGRQE